MAAANIKSVRSRARSRGVALAIVLWFVAGMSVLLAGIVLNARVDIKLAQLHATQARVEAAADGAIQLALAEFRLLQSRGETTGSTIFHSSQRVGDYTVGVSFTPLGGLIDINQAEQELLQLLFRRVPDIDEETAQELALRVVEWRSGMPAEDDSGGTEALEEETAVALQPSLPGAVKVQGDPDIRRGQFEAIEDLLLVPGIDRRIFEVLRDAIAVSHTGHVGVDWQSAPVEVLQALGDLDERDAIAVARDRAEADPSEAPPEALTMGFQTPSHLSTYRVDAYVPVDGSTYRRRKWVDRDQYSDDGLPWRFFRTEALVVDSSAGGRARGTVEARDG